MENKTINNEKLIESSVEMYNRTIDEMIKNMSEAKDCEGNFLFTEEDIAKRVDNVKSAFYSYIKETYPHMNDSKMLEYRKQLDNIDKTINEFKSENNGVFVLTEEMNKKRDTFAKASNFIVTFCDIPKIQIREVSRVNKKLLITYFESEDFCVEDYINKLRNSNKNGNFDITIDYLGKDLNVCRTDTFKRCRIKDVIPSELNQSRDDFNRVTIMVKFKKHDIATK